MVASRQREIIGQFSDDSDYKAAFYHDALCLIGSGHKRLIENNVDYSNEEEPNITGEIVRCTNEYIDSSLSSYSESLYSVTEDPPETGASAQTESIRRRIAQASGRGRDRRRQR